MYNANLSYQLLGKYLELVVENGLVMCVDDSFYVVTPRGKVFLELFDEFLLRCRRIKWEIRGYWKERRQLERMCFSCEDDL